MMPVSSNAKRLTTIFDKGWPDALKPPEHVPDGRRALNILMIFADQHHHAMTGYMGHPVVRTPNIDRLAAQGCVFEQAYCSSPLCSPSRQSFMSGLDPHRIGVWNNTSAMPEDTVTWAHMLAHAGYETSLFGKMHFNGYQKYYGFTSRPVLEGTPAAPHYSLGIRTTIDWRKPGPGSAGWLDTVAMVEDAGPDNADMRLPMFEQDLLVLRRGVETLERKSREHHARPWAMCLGFNLPHPPFKARPDLLERYRGKGDLPFNKAGLNRDACDTCMQQFYGLPGINLSDEATRRGREAYFALISEMDEHVGRIMEAVDAGPLKNNTVVLYFADHGEMAGEHGCWQKTTLLEGSVRVPLIVRWPGVTEAGRRVSAPVSLVDLYPTFLDIAGITMPNELSLDGHSLLGLMTGKSPDEPQRMVFGEFEGEGWNHPRAFIRKGGFKYVCNHTADCRLYDLDADPHEMRDLAVLPEYRTIRDQLHGELLKRWGDPQAIEREVIRAQIRGLYAPSPGPVVP